MDVQAQQYQNSTKGNISSLNTCLQRVFSIVIGKLSMLVNNINSLYGWKKLMGAEKIREILSYNLKKERKKLGLTQEKLAEISELSAQTLNDIEGCRMWVSDKTITKLAKVLHVDVYQLLVPISPVKSPEKDVFGRNKLLIELEDRVIRYIKQQFIEVIDVDSAQNIDPDKK